MIEIKLYEDIEDIVDDSKLLFVDIVAKYKEKWVLCKGKNRDTWECPGGHIEKGETPVQAANRELWEETGATKFDIVPVAYYGIKGSFGDFKSSEEVFGQIYYGDIKSIGELPNFEIEVVEFFKELPSNWTYHFAHPLFINLVEYKLYDYFNNLESELKSIY